MGNAMCIGSGPLEQCAEVFGGDLDYTASSCSSVSTDVPASAMWPINMGMWHSVWLCTSCLFEFPSKRQTRLAAEDGFDTPHAHQGGLVSLKPSHCKPQMGPAHPATQPTSHPATYLQALISTMDSNSSKKPPAEGGPTVWQMPGWCRPMSSVSCTPVMVPAASSQQSTRDTLPSALLHQAGFTTCSGCCSCCGTCRSSLGTMMVCEWW